MNYNNIIDCLLSLNLLDYKDKNKYIKTIYSISNNIENNYKSYRIKKRNGNYRTICEPNKILKHIQRKILAHILEDMEVSEYAKAYHKNISIVDNAICHVKSKVILKLDIIDFFDNIDFMNVYKSCFYNFPKSIGILLTTLCTYYGFLPQGAPTSAYISNLVMRNIDYEIGMFCKKFNINYTRYSDDMTFSGNFNPSIIINKVRKLLYKLNLKINNKKIKVIYNYHSQSVTGIVVNEKIQVKHKYRNRIRQEIYYINKYGIISHMKKLNIKNKRKYVNSLYGRILYVLQINKENIEFIKYRDIIKKYLHIF